MSGIANTLVAIGTDGNQSYWASNFASGFACSPFSAIPSSDGSLFFSGAVTDGTQRAYWVKYSSAGAISIQKTLDNPSINNEGFFGLSADSSGNIYAAGVTIGISNASIITAKYNSSGVIQWQRALDFAGVYDYGLRIGVDSSGDAYISGYTVVSGTNTNIVAAKYTSTGTLSWQRVFGNSLNEYPFAMTVDSSGNSFTVGYGETSTSSDDKPILVKRDSTGAVVWQNTYSLTPVASFRGVALDASGNIIVGGRNANPSAFGYAVILKLDSTGTPVWQRALRANDANEDDVFQSVAVGADGYIYASGVTYSTALSKYVALIAKYDQSGNLIFQRTISPSAGYVVNTAFISPSAPAMYCTIELYDSGAGVYRAIILRLPASGTKTGSIINVITGMTLTYAASSLVGQTPSFTASASTITDAAGTLTGSTPTLTDATSTYTRSLVSVT